MISLSLLFVLLLTGCVSAPEEQKEKRELHYDAEFGIMILVDEFNYIRITLDTEDPSLITSVSILATGEMKGKGYPDAKAPSDKEVPYAVYDNGSQELIVINFYHDDFTDPVDLYDYIRYAFSDDLKVKDFLSSEEFAYKQFFKDGIILDDISFEGVGHQVEEQYYR